MSELVATPEAGRQAAALGRWREAHALYSGADAGTLGPDDLEAYANAAWLTCRPDQAIELRQRAFARFQAGNEMLSAARVATQLGWDYSGRGAFSVAQGWLARADRLLADLPESREHGRLLLTRGMHLMEDGHWDEAAAHFAQAQQVGARLGDRDVESLALVARGRLLIHSGQVDAGLSMLDESSAAALSGELAPFSAGLVYCITIEACQALGDLRRAAEWTDIANNYCDRLEVSGFPGACRVHRAQALRLRGDWSGAEEQALAACTEISGFNNWVTGNGLYEAGEIRRIRGDFAAALETYRRADELGRDPQPGLALLRLAEGKVDVAASAVRRALDAVPEPLARLELLPAQVEIGVAAGDLRTARAAREEMERTVAGYKIASRVAPAFDAMLSMAAGRIAVAEGDWPSAERHLRHAREQWLQVGAPYEVARARLHLGIAYRRQGDEDAATTEFEAALAAFERLGARLDEERARELLGRLRTRRTFVFTDIVGSTQLLETLGDDKWRKLLGRHDDLVRQAILDAGGEVIKQTGDGFFAAFDQPKGAIQAAVGMQRALDAEVVAPDVRIGIHTGGAFHTEGDTADYGGQGVHVAARIGAVAAPGEILVSRASIEGAEGGLRLSDPRDLNLKGVADPVSVVSVEWR